jgi:hypothetical protein
VPKRDPIPHEEVRQAAQLVADELVAMVDMLHRAHTMTEAERVEDPRLHQALTEAGVMHLRGLIELLIGRPRGPHVNNLTRDDFAPGWEPSGSYDEVGRLGKALPVIDAKLAHLTRPRAAEPEEWKYWVMASIDVLNLFLDFMSNAHVFHLDAASPLDEGYRRAWRCVTWPERIDFGDESAS